MVRILGRETLEVADVEFLGVPLAHQLPLRARPVVHRLRIWLGGVGGAVLLEAAGRVGRRALPHPQEGGIVEGPGRVLTGGEEPDHRVVRRDGLVELHGRRVRLGDAEVEPLGAIVRGVLRDVLLEELDGPRGLAREVEVVGGVVEGVLVELAGGVFRHELDVGLGSAGAVPLLDQLVSEREGRTLPDVGELLELDFAELRILAQLHRGELRGVLAHRFEVPFEVVGVHVERRRVDRLVGARVRSEQPVQAGPGLVVLAVEVVNLGRDVQQRRAVVLERFRPFGIGELTPDEIVGGGDEGLLLVRDLVDGDLLVVGGGDHLSNRRVGRHDVELPVPGEGQLLAALHDLEARAVPVGGPVVLEDLSVRALGGVELVRLEEGQRVVPLVEVEVGPEGERVEELLELRRGELVVLEVRRLPGANEVFDRDRGQRRLDVAPRGGDGVGVGTIGDVPGTPVRVPIREDRHGLGGPVGVGKRQVLAPVDDRDPVLVLGILRVGRPAGLQQGVDVHGVVVLRLQLEDGGEALDDVVLPFLAAEAAQVGQSDLHRALPLAIGDVCVGDREVLHRLGPHVRNAARGEELLVRIVQQLHEVREGAVVVVELVVRPPELVDRLVVVTGRGAVLDHCLVVGDRGGDGGDGVARNAGLVEVVLAQPHVRVIGELGARVALDDHLVDIPRRLGIVLPGVGRQVAPREHVVGVGEVLVGRMGSDDLPIEIHRPGVVLGRRIGQLHLRPLGGLRLEAHVLLVRREELELRLLEVEVGEPNHHVRGVFGARVLAQERLEPADRHAA